MTQLATLAFFARHTGWHSYRKIMKKTVLSLVRKGFLEVNEFEQARFTGKVFALP
jgi:hypothetical protein